jgi:hypothetical protein
MSLALRFGSLWTIRPVLHFEKHPGHAAEAALAFQCQGVTYRDWASYLGRGQASFSLTAFTPAHLQEAGLLPSMYGFLGAEAPPWYALGQKPALLQSALSGFQQAQLATRRARAVHRHL